MPRRCTICYHENRSDINQELMARQMTYKEIAEKYDVSEHALKRHVKNHLKPMIKKVEKERKEEMEDDIFESLEVLDMVIQQGPKIIDQSTLNQVLRAIELKARLTGEAQPDTTIRFVWGKGTEEEDYEDDVKDSLKDFEEIEQADRESN